MPACYVFMQLPDYHEMIEHPMDFSTIREKLLNDSYSTLEDFEVCCVCGFTAAGGSLCFLYSC